MRPRAPVRLVGAELGPLLPPLLEDVSPPLRPRPSRRHHPLPRLSQGSSTRPRSRPLDRAPRRQPSGHPLPAGSALTAPCYAGPGLGPGLGGRAPRDAGAARPGRAPGGAPGGAPRPPAEAGAAISCRCCCDCMTPAGTPTRSVPPRLSHGCLHPAPPIPRTAASPKITGRGLPPGPQVQVTCAARFLVFPGPPAPPPLILATFPLPGHFLPLSGLLTLLPSPVPELRVDPDPL